MFDLRSEIEEFVRGSSAEYSSELSAKRDEFAAFKENVEVWRQDKEDTIKGLENTYNEKLRSEAPVEYWNEQAEKKDASFQK